MPKNRIVVILVIVLILTMGLSIACSSPAPSQEEPEEPAIITLPQEEPEEPTPVISDGATLLQERCTICHGLDRTTQAQKTREEWDETVVRMIEKGAELGEDEQNVLIKYLTETYGP